MCGVLERDAERMCGVVLTRSRKKAEQAEAREAIKAERAGNTAVGGAAGQTGGPANPVDQGGYPNGGPLSQ